MPLSAYEKAQFELLTAGLTFDTTEGDRQNITQRDRQNITQGPSPSPRMSARTGDILTITLALFGMFLGSMVFFFLGEGNVIAAIASGLMGVLFVYIAHTIETRTKRNKKFR